MVFSLDYCDDCHHHKAVHNIRCSVAECECEDYNGSA